VTETFSESYSPDVEPERDPVRWVTLATVASPPRSGCGSTWTGPPISRGSRQRMAARRASCGSPASSLARFQPPEHGIAMVFQSCTRAQAARIVGRAAPASGDQPRDHARPDALSARRAVVEPGCGTAYRDAVRTREPPSLLRAPLPENAIIGHAIWFWVLQADLLRQRVERIG